MEAVPIGAAFLLSIEKKGEHMYINGEDYELPKYTVKVMDGIESVNQAPAGRAKFSAMHQFLLGIFPREVVAEAVDGASFDSVDLAALAKLYTAVTAEYTRPIIEEQAAQLNAQIDALRPTLDALGKVQNLPKSSRQGFNMVK